MAQQQTLRRFQVQDDAGNRRWMIKYRITVQSDEITGDRMTPEPSMEEGFETADGTPAEEIRDKTYEIAGSDKLWREV